MEKLLGRKIFYRGFEKKDGFMIGMGLVLCIIFLAFAYLVEIGGLKELDGSIFKAVMSMRQPGLNAQMEILTYAGDWQIITMICILFFAFENMRKQVFLPATIMAILSYLMNKNLKLVFSRPRPEVSNFLIEQGGYSFPSGHSATSMAFYGVLIFLIISFGIDGKKSKITPILLVFLILVIAFSRIYLGVHYFSDTLGGLFEGLALLFILIPIMRAFNVIDRAD